MAQHNFCILNTLHLFFHKENSRDGKSEFYNYSEALQSLDYLSEIVTPKPRGNLKRMEGVFVIIIKA